ncbi:macrophage colony-stimulating factor 1 [Nothoprocta perdicaria]|uniref:macrophage colony-stimulating factor 1 n=1 Tax=Nothoprocta perdicaria TaxID=30464 RepID=UPI000E1C110E|nr:macrophage colony-stimulating factor 1 [Nothoprocta perdicaria]
MLCPAALQVSLLSAALLLLCCGIPETEQNSYCQQIITPDHLAQLQELADTQMLHPGRVSFTFIHKEQLNDSICYVKAAFPLLGELLGRTVFKENSSNARRLQVVQRMYSRIDENVDPCIREEDDEERELSQNCLAEFSTSPYEMLVLVKRFFEELAVLLQRQETFAKDCSHVYRARCPSPRRPTASAPGVGTDAAGHELSPALPPATQHSLSASSAPVPSGHPHGALAWPPATAADGGSGTEEELGAWLGAPASPSPAMQAPAALPDAPGTAGLVAGDISAPPGGVGLAQRAPQAGTAAPEPPERHGASVLLPEEAPGEASGAGQPVGQAPQPVARLRVPRPPAAPERHAGAWGPSGPRERHAGGPSAHSRFVPSAEQRRKEPRAAASRRAPLLASAVASAVAVLLAVGGLLFYKRRILRRRPQQSEQDPEEPERRVREGPRCCSGTPEPVPPGR